MTSAGVDQRHAQFQFIEPGPMKPVVPEEHRTAMTDTLDKIGEKLYVMAKQRKHRGKGKLTIGHFTAQTTKPNDPSDPKPQQGAVMLYDRNGRMMTLPYMFPTPLEAEAVVLILNHALSVLKTDPNGVLLQSDFEFMNNLDELSYEAWEAIGEKRPEPTITREAAEKMYREAGFIAPANTIEREQFMRKGEHLQLLKDVIARVPVHPNA